jgi:acyl-CoA dehydrogenase
MAEHAFAARMAAQIGCGVTGEGGDADLTLPDPLIPDLLRVAVAKARTSEAALEVASLSHSIHGAMGFTEAFDLQLLTRRLHHWRQTAGSESYWHRVLGQALVARPEPLSLDLMRTVTDRSAVPV